MDARDQICVRTGGVGPLTMTRSRSASPSAASVAPKAAASVAAPAPKPPTAAPKRNPWLPFDLQPGGVRLYCLPHAGGSASVYRSWFGRIDGVAVCPVQPPGRETRLRDPWHTHMDPLVAELADAVLAHGQGPYAIYGHSLGGLVGFELVREIRRRGGRGPEHLIVSGCPAPDLDPDAGAPPVAGASDAEIVALLRGLGGTPEWMLSDPAVLKMILPPFRADFSVKETYEYRPQPPLDIPVTAIASTDDPRAGAASMAGWRDQTSRRFQAHTMVGGHFAVLEQPDVTHKYISEALRSRSASYSVGCRSASPGAMT